MLTAAREKTCRICAKTFKPFSTTAQICGAKRCLSGYVEALDKTRKADLKRRKEAVKTRSDWMVEAQAAINKYARLRDIRLGYGCITCHLQYENRQGGAFDAGHMHSRGSRPELRFHLHNIALQCVKDNRYLAGRALEFRAAMVVRHGVAKIEALEAIKGPAKFSIDYLKRIKQVFAKKARRMEKRLELQD